MSASAWVWIGVALSGLAFLGWAFWPLVRAFFLGERIRIARRFPDGSIRIRELDTGEERLGVPTGSAGSYREVVGTGAAPDEHG
jgi:hypothetical protein